jgi:hypothetical protein
MKRDARSIPSNPDHGDSEDSELSSVDKGGGNAFARLKFRAEKKQGILDDADKKYARRGNNRENLKQLEKCFEIESFSSLEVDLTSDDDTVESDAGGGAAFSRFAACSHGPRTGRCDSMPELPLTDRLTALTDRTLPFTDRLTPSLGQEELRRIRSTGFCDKMLVARNSSACIGGSLQTWHVEKPASMDDNNEKDVADVKVTRETRWSSDGSSHSLRANALAATLSDVQSIHRRHNSKHETTLIPPKRVCDSGDNRSISLPRNWASTMNNTDRRWQGSQGSSRDELLAPVKQRN